MIDPTTITTIPEADAALSRVVLTLQMQDLTIKSLAQEITEAVAAYGDVPMGDIVKVDVTTRTGSQLPYSVRSGIAERMTQRLGKRFNPIASHRVHFYSLLPITLDKPEDRITCVDSQYQSVVDLMIRIQHVSAQRDTLRADWLTIADRYGRLAEDDPSALDGLYVAAKTSRRSAQGYASATRRNKSAITITGDAMHGGMLPYTRLPGGHSTKQQTISVTAMYRRYVDQFGNNPFLFEDTDSKRFTFADSRIHVLLPREQAEQRRHAVSQYVKALTEVRATALTDINIAERWDQDNLPLIRKQIQFTELVGNIVDPMTWTLGYGETRNVQRQFLNTLLATVPDTYKDLARAAAEQAAWDKLGGPLSQAEIDLLSQRPVVNKYHGDELWQKAVAEQNLPEMIW